MRPLKAKDFISKVAKEQGVSEEIASVVIKSYWKEIRTSLSELRSPRIHVANLGDFTIKHWLIEDYKNKLNNTVPLVKDTPKRLSVINTITEKLSQIDNVEKMLNEEQQRKDFIKIHKKNITNVKRIME